jgi:hypothetical protein
VSDPNDNSIPVLHEILVPGKSTQSRQTSGEAADPAALDTPREPSFKAEPVLAPQPVLTPQQTQAVEPVLAPDVAAHASTPAATHSATHAPAAHRAVKKHARDHHVEDASAPSAGVFDRIEPATPPETGAIVPPDLAQGGAAQPAAALDADVIADKLRGRLASFLTDEGRGIVEARCREAMQEHSGWLVSQITREVALALEAEMSGWVREAVEEEIARRASDKA